MREKRSWSERDGGRKEENREMETPFNALSHRVGNS